MHSPRHDQDKLEKVIHKVIRSYIEKVLFPIVFGIGVYLLYLSRSIQDFWPSLYLNLGSNLVVFVFLFWAFQYFTGRQPGTTDQESYDQFRNIIDQPQASADYGDIVSNKSAPTSMRAVNAPGILGNTTLPQSNNDGLSEHN